MDNSRNKQFIGFKLCVVLWSVMKPHAVLLHLAWDVNHPLVQCAHAGCVPAVSHLVPLLVTGRRLEYGSACVQVTLILLKIMSPEHKSSDAGSLEMPQRSCQVLPLSDKVCMYRGKNSICRVQYCPWFQATIGGLGPCALRVRGDYCRLCLWKLACPAPPTSSST